MGGSVVNQGRPSVALRASIAITIGILCTAIILIITRQLRPVSDFDQCWLAARALVTGANPYDLIGPGRTFEWRWPFYYPMTAAVVSLPFAWLDAGTARLLFSVTSSSLLAFAVTRRGYHRLLLFLSAGFCFSLLSAQWSPLLTAAALLPILSWVFAAKPTVGLALFVAFPSRTAVVGGMVILVLSLVAMPSWPGIWWHVIQYAPHMRTPLFTVVGPFVLLVLLRWRRPEARLLAVLACVPQTMVLYVTVPLFLIPASGTESLLLLVLSWITQVITFTMSAKPPGADFYSQSALAIVTLMYLPCVAMVLRRPNEGALPKVVETALERAMNWRNVAVPPPA